MIKFLVCGDVKAPQRKAGQDAGFDFFVPNYSEEFEKQLEECNPDLGDYAGVKIVITGDGHKKAIILPPNSDIKIPSMVRALIPEDECLLLVNKSGVALKQKLTVGACLVDSSYEGIIHLHMFNIGKNPVAIEFGQKLVQGVPYKLDCEEHQIFYETEVSKEDFYKDHNHDRGDGGFGSTGLK